MSRFNLIAIGLSLFSFLTLASCGNSPSNQIGVTANPLCVLLLVGGPPQQFCAKVTDNFGGTVSQSVNWEILGGNANGNFALANGGTAVTTTTTSNTQTVTYQPPAVMPSNCAVLIEARSNQDPASENQVTVLLQTNINPPPGQPFSCPPPSGPTSCVVGPTAVPLCP